MDSTHFYLFRCSVKQHKLNTGRFEMSSTSGVGESASQHCSGSNTPMTDSSCEFVNIGDEELQAARESVENVARG